MAEYLVTVRVIKRGILGIFNKELSVSSDTYEEENAKDAMEEARLKAWAMLLENLDPEDDDKIDIQITDVRKV